jgi:proline iminopeptidase
MEEVSMDTTALRRVLERSEEPRIAIGAALGVVASFGVVAGWLTPRGPLTTVAALATMLAGAAVGALVGAIWRSRWVMLVAPVVFVAVFELVRIGAVGPTVDGPRPWSTYGIMALVVGRGIHGLLVLLPMVVGTVYGRMLARRLLGDAGEPSRRLSAGLAVRRVLAVLGTVAVLGVAAGVARPAGTAAITDADGRRIQGSIAELSSVRIGDHDLGVMIRGHRADAPVLLFLAGGPGGSEVGAMRRHLPMLEKDFVVVTFDQRGTGRSHEQLEPTSTLTLDNAVADVVAITDHLRDRFDVDRVVLVGQSWGTLLGALAVDEAPDRFSAFVGIGQMVSPTETDRIFYDDTLAWARDEGRNGLVAELEENGPPPYDDIIAYEAALSYEHDVYPYDRSANSEGIAGFSENLFVGEYTLLEQMHALGAFLDVFSILYPQLSDVDLRDEVIHMDVPVFQMMGRYEARGRSEPAAEWFELLDAPHKEWIEFDTSGHRPLFEQPEAFHQAMVDHVLPLVR